MCLAATARQQYGLSAADESQDKTQLGAAHTAVMMGSILQKVVDNSANKPGS